MKRHALILFASLSLFRAQAAPDPLVISNNAYVTFTGDSLWATTSDGVGTRYVSEWQAAEACLHPTRVIFVYDGSHSGGTMDIRLTNDLPSIVGFMGYQSNDLQHILFINATDNSGLSSNQMFLATSNCCMFPTYSSANGAFPLTASTGWMSTHPFQIIPMGYIPGDASDGAPSTEGQRSGGQYQAGLLFGFMAVDMWLDRVLIWTNDIVNHAAANIGYNSTGHVLEGGCFDQVVDTFRRTTPSDTNVANSMIDFATSTVVWTNNSVVFSITKTARSITFSRLDNALAPPFFVPHLDGSLTNDSRPAFTLDPANATFFNFGVGVSNLPAGNYTVTIDGILVGEVPSTVLASANGWNMFTNTVGPLWDAREQVLLRVLDWRYVDRKTLIPKSAGDSVGEVSVGSFSNDGMVKNLRGDDLIAHLNGEMTLIQTNYLPQYPQSIYYAATNAVMTPHTFTFALDAPADLSVTTATGGAVHF